MRNRYIFNSIGSDPLASGKMSFISGPRQVGKTTMAKALLQNSENYYTWDDADFRKLWIKSPASALSNHGDGPIVLDEIHKDRKWKSKLKGIYDKQGTSLPIIITGSARLDIFRRGGESLQGES